MSTTNEDWGPHPAQEALAAARKLQRMIHKLAEDEMQDYVGLGLAANVQAQIVDALDRNWQILLPLVLNEDSRRYVAEMRALGFEQRGEDL